MTTVLGTFNASGAFFTPLLTFAANPGLHGATIYHQVLGLDPTANSFGLTSSNAMGRQVVAPYAPSAVGVVGTIAGANAATGSPTATAARSSSSGDARRVGRA